MFKDHRTFFKSLFFFTAAVCLSAPVSAADRTLVLFPFAVYGGHGVDDLRAGLRSMFLSRLSGGGLAVVTDEAFGSLLAAEEKNGRITGQRVQELTRKLKADYGVFGSVTTMAGGASLDLSLLDLTKTPPKATPVSEAMKEDEFIPKIAEVANRFRAIIEGRYVERKGLVGPAPTPAANESGGNLFARVGRPGGSGTGEGGFFRPTRQTSAFRPTGRISLQMTVMAFDAGDLDGDGSLELAVLGRKEVRIYVKKGKTYRLKDTLKSSLGEDFLKVSVGDADGNGRAEVYLVSRYNIRARSTVYEWDGKFKRVYRRWGHMRTVRNTRGGRPLLLFQDSKVDAFFSGNIWYMSYAKGERPTKSAPLPGPRGVRFYTVTPLQVVKAGDRRIIALGRDSHLGIWDAKGHEVWRGEKQIGGTNNAIRIGNAPPGDLPPRISFQGRPAFGDIDGDGRKEFLAARNIPLVEGTQDFKVFVASQLIAYRYEGGSLIPGWDTRKIKFSLVDIQTVNKILFLAAQKGKISGLMKGSSRIIWFDLQ